MKSSRTNTNDIGGVPPLPTRGKSVFSDVKIAPSEDDIRRALADLQRKADARVLRRKARREISDRRKAARIEAKRILNPVSNIDQIRKCSTKLKTGW